eukprot:11463039-Alexandrium_andersonii.AAC.1
MAHRRLHKAAPSARNHKCGRTPERTRAHTGRPTTRWLTAKNAQIWAAMSAKNAGSTPAWICHRAERLG